MLNTKVEIRTRIIDGQIWWLVRDIGRMLGYGSDGGNLSRNINGKWRTHFRFKSRTITKDVNIRRAKTEKGGDAFWASNDCLIIILVQITRSEPKYCENMREFMSLYHRSPAGSMTLPLHQRVEKLEADMRIITRRLNGS